MRLARAVRAEDRDAFAVEDLQVEGLHQARQLKSLAGDGPYAGATALDAHGDVLLARRLGRRARLLELAQAGLGGGVAGRQLVADGGRLTEVQDELLQLGVLLVPAAAQLLEAGEAFTPGLVVRGEAAAVHPGVGSGRRGLHGDDLLGGAGEEFTVVGDEQDRLAGLLEPLLQPPLAGHVKVVVRLVQQQDLFAAAQQRLQHEPLLLTAGERAHLPELRLVVRHSERGHGAHVPQRLELVAVHLGPVRQGLRVGELGRLVVDGHDAVLGPVDLGRDLADARRGDRHEQVAYGRLVAYGAHELAHHAEAAAHGDRAAVRFQLAGDQPQQGRLARAVGPDQGDHGAFADPEGHIAEERPPVGEVVLEVCGFQMSHDHAFCGAASRPGKRLLCPSGPRPGPVRASP